MTTDLIHRLQGIVDSSVENDGNRAIARYMLQNLASLDRLSVQSIANDCYASIATVSRFVRALGFESFSQMKKQSAQYRLVIGESVRSVPDLSFSLQDGSAPLTSYVDEITDSLNRFAVQFDYAAADRLVTLLEQCRSAALFGIYQPGLIARHLQFLLLSAGRYTEYYDLLEDHAERARTMTDQDLAVIFSVDGNYLSSSGDVIHKMKNQGVHLILVTQNPDSGFHALFEQVILLGGKDSSRAGCYKLQLFTEVLFSRYVSRLSNSEGRTDNEKARQPG